MENTLRTVKNIINGNIDLLKKADVKSVKNIEDFFNFTTTIPLVMLYTEEGVKIIESKLFDTSAEYQNEVIEFMLRIKPEVVTIDNFEEICSRFLQEDIIINKLYTPNDKQAKEETEDKEFTKLDSNLVGKYYLLNLILAYNTAI